MGLDLLLTLVIIVGIVWLVFWIADSMGVPAPIAMIIKAIAGLIAIFYLINLLQSMT